MQAAMLLLKQSIRFLYRRIATFTLSFLLFYLPPFLPPSSLPSFLPLFLPPSLPSSLPSYLLSLSIGMRANARMLGNWTLWERCWLRERVCVCGGGGNMFSLMSQSISLRFAQASLLLATVVATVLSPLDSTGQICFALQPTLCILIAFSLPYFTGSSSSSSASSLPNICWNHLLSTPLSILFLIVCLHTFCVYLCVIFIESC